MILFFHRSDTRLAPLRLREFFLSVSPIVEVGGLKYFRACHRVCVSLVLVSVFLDSSIAYLLVAGSKTASDR